MNLQTGQTEAKLLDPQDPAARKNTALHTVPGQQDTALHTVPGQQDTPEDPENTPEDQAAKVVKMVRSSPHVAGLQVMEADDGEQTVFSHGKLTPQQLQDAMQNFKFEDAQVATDEVRQ